MIFVMSGLDGSLEAYKSLMKKHGITENDAIYVLGGIAGGDLSLAAELSMNPSIYPVMSKKDYTALKMLGKFDKLSKSGAAPDAEYIAEMQEWAKDGGMEMLGAFREFDEDMKEGILDFFENFASFEEAECAGTEYILLSAGVTGAASYDDLFDLETEDFIGAPLDLGKEYFDGKTVITADAGIVSEKPVFKGNNVLIGVGRPYCVRLGGEVECL